MRAFLIALFVAAWLSPTSAAQTTWHVDDDADPNGDGLTWDSAFRFLQDALAAANQGDEIRVAGGTYQPDRRDVTPNGTGDRGATFALIANVSLYGGYAGLADPNNPDWRDLHVFESVLSGDLAGDDGVVSPSSDDNSYHVVTAIDVPPTATLDGFTVTGGNADGFQPDESGAGILLVTSKVSLTGCTLTRNTASDRGGGLYATGSWAVITNSQITRNAAGAGGGAFIETSHADVEDSSFTENSALGAGGLYVFTDATAALSGCTFQANEATFGGGAVFRGNKGALVANSEFAGNLAADSAGAIEIDGSGQASLANCVCRNNEASDGAAVALVADGFAKISRCSFSENSATSGGGAINVNLASSAVISDCHFASNRAASGGAIYAIMSASSISRSTFNSNGATITGGGVVRVRP